MVVKLGDIITDRYEIKRCQKDLENKLKNRAKEIKDAQIGFLKEEFYYFEDLDFWYYTNEYNNIYRNAFGLGNPRKNNSIDLQINIPFDGKNKQVAGKFVKEDDEKIWIGHNGTIKGKKEGIGKNAFLEYFESEMKIVPYKDDDRLLKEVTQLDSDDLVKDLRDFVEEVKKKIKKE